VREAEAPPHLSGDPVEVEEALRDEGEQRSEIQDSQPKDGRREEQEEGEAGMEGKEGGDRALPHLLVPSAWLCSARQARRTRRPRPAWMSRGMALWFGCTTVMSRPWSVSTR